MKNSDASKQALLLLQEIINWWDEWKDSDNPTEMEDPPIDAARSLLSQMKVND